MMHVTDNQKARKRKTYADIVKVTQNTIAGFGKLKQSH